MAETSSRDRVTITLGRRGRQVVKRGGLTSNAHSDSMPAGGTKRSIRDRLGSSGGDGHSSLLNGNSKRPRGDIGMRGKGLDDVHIDKDDLRLKLMRKNASKQARNETRKFGGDLRDKLKKTRKIPTVDSQRYHPEQRNMSGYGLAPPPRSSDDLPKMDSHRESYSPWSSDNYKRRSPDRFPHSFRGLSPPRNVEDTRRMPLSRSYDDIRPVRYMNGKDVIDSSRPMNSVTFQSSPAMPLSSIKPVAPHITQLPPPSGLVPKSSFMVEEQQTVDGLLHSLGLGKYVVIFKAEEVDMTALKQMGENDLKELGIPMGPRKKIILSLLPRSKRP